MTPANRLLFILLLFLFSTQASATDFSGKQDRSLAPLIQPAQKIPVGEKLVYDVSWMGVHVGFGELEVREKTEVNGRAAYHIVAVARTNEFLSKIYPVEDQVHSWIDAETFQSLRFEKKVSEGSYRAHERVTYDEASKMGYYESLKNGSKKEFEVSVPVHDAISAFYWVRRQMLAPGGIAKTLVNNGEKDYALEVKTLRRENREIRGKGVEDSLVIEPRSLYQGILDKRGRVWVHLRNDGPRTPLFFTFRTPFGPIVGALSHESHAH